MSLRIKKPSNHRKQFQDLFTRMYPELNNELNCKEGQSSLSVKNITFVVTEECNLNCSYCYQCSKDFKKVMSKETAKKAIDLLFDEDRLNGYVSKKTSKAIILDFIGGEPLLNVEVMDFIVDYFVYKSIELGYDWAKYYMISISTNGVSYFNEDVMNFFEKNRNHLSVSITIDGDKELHDACRKFPDGRGSYDIVEKALKHSIKEFGLRATKVTLAPENIMYISRAIPHLFELGLTDLNANCVFEDVWAKERDTNVFYEELIKLADYIIDNKIYEYGYCSLFDDTIGKPMNKSDNKNWCGGNGQMLAIGTDGRLFPCLRFMQYSLADQPEICIGNVDDGIQSENQNKKLKVLNSITRISQSTEECINCPVASGCAWCTGYNYDKFGTPNKRATFICWMHKARVLANHYYNQKLAKVTGIPYTEKLNLSEADIKFIKTKVVRK